MTNINIENDLKKKHAEIQSVFEEEKKQMHTQLGEEIKQTLTEKNKEKYAHLESLIKEEEKILQTNLQDLLGEQTGEGTEKQTIIYDLTAMEEIKKILLDELQKIELRFIEEDKVLTDKLYLSLTEKITIRISTLEDRLSAQIATLFNEITILLDKKTNAAFEKQPPPVTIETSKLAPQPKLFFPIRDLTETGKSIKDLFSEKNHKVSFWGTGQSAIIGSFNCRKKQTHKTS